MLRDFKEGKTCDLLSTSEYATGSSIGQTGLLGGKWEVKTSSITWLTGPTYCSSVSKTEVWSM
jgi:hypothetical protein